MRADVILTGPVAPDSVLTIEQRVAASIPDGTWRQDRPGRRSLVWPDGRRISAALSAVDRATIDVYVASNVDDDRHNRWAVTVFDAVADALPGVLVELFDENDDVVRRRTPRQSAA